MTKKVLIVDDEAHIRALLEESLEDISDLGVEIYMAENGQKGLQMATELVPNVMLLDVMMPKMNGFEVAKSIKNDQKLKDIYIIMLTAKGQEVDRVYGLKTGVNEYVTKPFDPDYILKKVREVLELE
jgi:DNA-binding response OmpR family regulator